MQINSPSVTLIVLAYKQEKFIREAVESALAQTYTPLEIIVSDDCSPDRTFAEIEDIISAYKGPHTVITNRNPQNIGLGAHFHKAYELSQGMWIVAAAGDDISEPQRVANLVEAVRHERTAVAAASACMNIDEDGKRLPDQLPRRLRDGAVHRFGEYDWVSGFQKGGDTGVPGMSAMWHRSLFAEFPPMGEGIFAEDVVLGFRAYLTGTIVFLKDVLMRHRFHGDNIAGFVSDDIAWMEERQIQFLKKVRPSLEMNLATYNYYLSRHQKKNSDPRILDLIRYSLWLNEVNATWWEHGLLWKCQTCVKFARTGGLKKLKRYIPRLLPKPTFLKFKHQLKNRLS